jgi:hypothetical protein
MRPHVSRKKAASLGLSGLVAPLDMVDRIGMVDVVAPLGMVDMVGKGDQATICRRK